MEYHKCNYKKVNWKLYASNIPDTRTRSRNKLKPKKISWLDKYMKDAQ
jgi:hypothetical protein